MVARRRDEEGTGSGEEARKMRAFGSEEVDEQATMRGEEGEGGGEQSKREGRRELDVRTNAICMILHVLARPGAAPIGFQLSAYVFCLLFWLYGMAGTRVVESEGRRRRGRRGGVKRRQRLPREIAVSTRRERKLFCLVFLDGEDAR